MVADTERARHRPPPSAERGAPRRIARFGKAAAIVGAAGVGAAAVCGLYLLTIVEIASAMAGVAIATAVAVVALGWGYRALSGRLDLLNKALGASADAQLIVAPDGAIAYANAAFQDLFPASGAPPLARLAGALGDPERQPEFARLRGQAAAGTRAVATLPLRDGSGGKTGWFAITVNPVAGRAGYSFWTIQEVTARHEAETALRQSRERFQRVFADAPAGIALIDQFGHLVEANRALGELFEAAPAELIRKPLIGFVAEDSRRDFALRLAAAKTAEPPVHPAPIELRLKGPRDKTCVAFLSRLAGGGERGDGDLMLHFIDVTEQKNLEAQVVQSQKMQAVGQLAGGVAHDFNNLLTAMIGFCDLLLMRFRPGDPSFADIMQIKQNANRAANLVRQLLAFSRQQTLQPRVIDITDVLIELSHLLRRLIGERIELKVVHGRDLGLAKVDQGQLEQVVINLAVNARDAMPDGGTLTIRTANLVQPVALRRGPETIPAGEYVLLEMADTGTGIAKENIARIFEPFFSTKEVGSGTGLGLSTAYGIVKQTGGFILVDSAPGQGATFRIYLPRHRLSDSLTDLQPEPVETALPRDLSGIGTIMFVEDEDPVRIFGARALRNKGYTVIEAKSGEAALDLIRDGNNAIDLLITDVAMPRMDGPALVREAREIRRELRVIFISGYAEDEFRRRLDGDSRIHFLSKPFSLKELAAKVKDVLRAEPG